MLPKVTITLPPNVIEDIDSRGDNRSGSIARDLDRLYTLYKHALRDIPLSVGEACLLCDVLNGTMMDANSAVLLWAEVSDGVRLNGLDRKWDVDGKAFVARLRALDHIHALALIDAAERFWSGDLSEDARKAVGRYFHIVDILPALKEGVSAPEI